MSSKKDLERLEKNLDHSIKELKHDQEKLREIAEPETMSITNVDIIPIIQEVIKGEEDK